MTERELLEKTIAECEILLNDLKRSRILMNEKLMNVERFLGDD